MSNLEAAKAAATMRLEIRNNPARFTVADYGKILLLAQGCMNAIIVCVVFAISASAQRLPEQSLKQVVLQVQSSGEEEAWSSIVGELFGFRGDVPSRFVETSHGNLFRNCRIVFDETDKKKPLCLILGTYRQNKKTLDTEMVQYRVELDGTISKAVKITGKIDERGEAVLGSGIDTALSVDSRSVLGDAKAELEYWLRRFKRKTTKRAAAPASPLQPLAASR